MTRQRVLVACRWFPPAIGGVETLLAQIYRDLPGHDVRVMAPAIQGASAYDRVSPADYEVVRVRGAVAAEKKGAVLALGWGLVSRMVRGTDQVHCGHILLALPAWFASRVTGVPYVVWTYGSEFTTTRFARTRRFLMNRASAVVTISPGMHSELIERGITERLLHLVPPGVDVDDFEPDPVGRLTFRERNGLKDETVLLSVGRLHPTARHKGFDTVIRAFGELTASRTESGLLLVIVGDGPDAPRLKAMVGELNLNDRVRFEGSVSDEDLRSWYGAADLFVQGTRREETGAGYSVEGFGIVFLEAQASGLPVVTGAAGGASFSVAPESGIVIADVTPSLLAEQIDLLLADRSRLARMGQGARAWVAEEFGWTASRTKLSAVCDVAASRSRPRFARSR